MHAPPSHCTALEYSSHPNPQNMTELPGLTLHTVATQTLQYIQTYSCTSPYVIMCHLLLENTNPSIIYGLKWAVTDAIPLEGNTAFKFKLENNGCLISFFPRFASFRSSLLLQSDCLVDQRHQLHVACQPMRALVEVDSF